MKDTVPTYNELMEQRDSLRAELEKSNQLAERLRCDLADPPIDVQEIIIKKMHLVSEDELEKEKALSEKRWLMAQELCGVLDAIIPLSPAVIKCQKMEKEK